jgi:hypothetical protein
MADNEDVSKLADILNVLDVSLVGRFGGTSPGISNYINPGCVEEYTPKNSERVLKNIMGSREHVCGLTKEKIAVTVYPRGAVSIASPAPGMTLEESQRIITERLKDTKYKLIQKRDKGDGF